MFQEYFRAGLASAGCAFGYFFGGWTTTLIILMYFIVIDYVTGFLAAAIHGQLNSKKGFAGAAKKVMIFVGVGVAHLLDTLLNTNFIMTGAVFYYLSGELISIGENAAVLGVPLPEIILKALEKTKGGGTVGQ